MHNLQRCIRSCRPENPLRAVQTALYTTRSEPRRANVIAHSEAREDHEAAGAIHQQEDEAAKPQDEEPSAVQPEASEKSEEDSKLKRWREGYIQAAAGRNTYRQKHATAIERLVRQDAQLKQLREELKLARRERGDNLPSSESFNDIAAIDRVYDTTSATLADAEATLRTLKETRENDQQVQTKIADFERLQEEHEAVTGQLQDTFDNVKVLRALREEQDEAQEKIEELRLLHTKSEHAMQILGETANPEDAIEALRKEELDAQSKAETLETLRAERNEAIQKLEEAGNNAKLVETLERERDDARQRIKALERVEKDYNRAARMLEEAQSNMSSIEALTEERNDARDTIVELQHFRTAFNKAVNERDKIQLQLDEQSRQFDALTRSTEQLNKEQKKFVSQMEGSSKKEHAHTKRLQERSEELEADKIRLRRRNDSLRSKLHEVETALHNARTNHNREIKLFEDILSARKADKARFRKKCLSHDLNVIQRMLPSMPEMPITMTQSLTYADATMRLQRWLVELEGSSLAESVQTQAMIRHDVISREKDILCIYTDGAFFSGSKMGSAAVIPVMAYARLQHGITDGAKTEPNSGMTELDALMLALESAAMHAADNQRVAIFTDYDAFATHDPIVTWLGELYRESTLNRAVDALQKLEAKGTQLRICWLGKNSVMPGNVLAHQAARIAGRARRTPGIPYEISDAQWYESLLSRAVDDARETTYLSDIG